MVIIIFLKNFYYKCLSSAFSSASGRSVNALCPLSAFPTFRISIVKAFLSASVFGIF